VRTSEFGPRALTSCVAAAMLAACGGSQPPIGAPGAIPKTSAVATHTARGGSWMLPEAKSEDLLYISNDGDATVSVFAYRSGRLVGTLTGFGVPWGLCSDKAGNVFVTDWSKEQVVEYLHGGSNPIKTLEDPYYSPDDCAVDPLTGDLAVASLSGQGSVSYPAGDISIYAKAQGVPKVYTIATNPHFVACAYDDVGNLFADAFGYNYGRLFQMVELARHHKNLVELRFRPQLSPSDGPAGLQWDGKYIALAIANNTIYQYSVRNGVAHEQGSTGLSGQGVDLGLFSVGKFGSGSQSTQLIALGSNEAQYYNYPAGGMPTGLITNGLDRPLGITGSRAHR
jgi:hypothetical protein